MILAKFTPFVGFHCETTTTNNLLRYQGVNLSEAMCFGLGEGLGFVYWDAKSLTFPFIGGRSKPGHITRNLAKNLGLQVTIEETSSVNKAWENVKKQIDSSLPVGLKLDYHYLDYVDNKSHFAAHYVTIYGYDHTDAYLVDTALLGGVVKTRLSSLEEARNAKGPMSSRNLSYTILKDRELPDLKSTILFIIKRNAWDFLNPPIQNAGYKGIGKASNEVRKWLQRSENSAEDLPLVATLLERGGTGGASFRNIYRDFLKECLSMIDNPNLERAYEMFIEIAPMWTEFSSLIFTAGKRGDQTLLDEASNILSLLAVKERDAMTVLANL